jgi:hypothetical protein
MNKMAANTPRSSRVDVEGSPPHRGYDCHFVDTKMSELTMPTAVNAPDDEGGGAANDEAKEKEVDSIVVREVDGGASVTVTFGDVSVPRLRLFMQNGGVQILKDW